MDKKEVNEKELEFVSGGLTNNSIILVKYKKTSYQTEVYSAYVTYGELLSYSGDMSEKVRQWCNTKRYFYQSCSLYRA